MKTFDKFIGIALFVASIFGIAQIMELENQDKTIEAYESIHQQYYSKLNEAKRIKDTLQVDVRVYNVTKEQCGNTRGITHSGLKITKPERWVAVSPDLLKRFPHFSLINLKIPLAPMLDGKYMVTDKTDNMFRNRVDILVQNPHQIKLIFALKGQIIY